LRNRAWCFLVDLELAGERSHAGQSLARHQFPSGDSKNNLFGQLLPDRYFALLINADFHVSWASRTS